MADPSALTFPLLARIPETPPAEAAVVAVVDAVALAIAVAVEAVVADVVALATVVVVEGAAAVVTVVDPAEEVPTVEASATSRVRRRHLSDVPKLIANAQDLPSVNLLAVKRFSALACLLCNFLLSLPCQISDEGRQAPGRSSADTSIRRMTAENSVSEPLYN